MKWAYVRAIRILRALLRVTGLLSVIDRLAQRSRIALWARSILSIHDMEELAAIDVPWWTFESAEVVGAFLRTKPEARVLEWGSGASTMWLARRAAAVTSIEHHSAWAARVRQQIPANVSLLLVEPERCERPAVPSHKPGHRGLDFAGYVSAVDAMEGDFDLVVIDGRAREACLPKALERLAPGGMIVFDNVDRARYRRALDVCGGQITVTRGLTPALPYPTRTALVTASG